MTPIEEPGPPERTRARQRNPLPSEVDVAIVGCGLGGLSTAAYLAKAGLKVCALDAHYVAGGCGTVFSRGPSDARYHFDIGLHYVGDCGPDGTLPTILREVGAAPVDFLPMDPDGFDTIVLPDLEFRIPVGLDAYRERLIAAFPKERRGIERYVQLLMGVRDIGGRLDRNDGKLSLGIGARVLTHYPRLALYQNATIGRVLDDVTTDRRLRAVILGQHGDYGLPPSRVSAMLHLGLADHYFKGAYYPRGGGQILADRLAQAVESHGGTIHLRRPVGRILIEGGRAVGLETAPRRNHPTERVRAKVVVSNADLQKTLRDLVGREHLPSAWRAKIDRGFELPSALFITCLGIRGDLRDFGFRNSNYWVFDDSDTEALYARAERDERPVARAAYITSASMKDPGTPHHAPPGHSTLEVMSIVPGAANRWGVSEAELVDWGYKRNDEYRQRKSAVEAQLLATLERRFPGIGERIVFKESATPVTHTRYTGATDGGSYGIAVTPAQFGKGRPGYEAILPGLHLCGVSTRMNHGIVGAMTSGRAASRAVLEALSRK
jgi:phytoene dehydrogenase-like protein